MADTLRANGASGGRFDKHPMVVASEGAYEYAEQLVNQGVADTVRSHPRPGSNSNGNLVATSITLASDPISARDLAQPSTKRNGDPGVVQMGASVRRLTPTECERLQGFPDGWTDLGGTPDSRRYAALGDAVTVPVAEWIGRRIRSAA